MWFDRVHGCEPAPVSYGQAYVTSLVKDLLDGGSFRAQQGVDEQFLGDAAQP